MIALECIDPNARVFRKALKTISESTAHESEFGGSSQRQTNDCERTENIVKRGEVSPTPDFCRTLRAAVAMAPVEGVLPKFGLEAAGADLRRVVPSIFDPLLTDRDSRRR